ncbi:MAG: S41 family peptidase [Xanthomonadales bacterium]|nr:S41 family peptidase [Xanthomonadales bacterium]
MPRFLRFALLLPWVLPAVLAAATAVPMPTSGEWPALLMGDWQSRGYGHRLRISADGARLYHFTSIAGADRCWPAEEDDSLLAAVDRYQLGGEGRELSLFGLGEPHPYRYDRLSEWPAACEQPAASDIRSRFQHFADLMQAHYAFFELYQVDWSARRAAGLASLDDKSDEAALFAAMQQALQGLRDGHLSLSAEVAGEPRQVEGNRGRTLERISVAARAAGEPAGPARRRWQADLWQAIAKEALGGEGRMAGNDFLQAGWLSPQIGYLAAYTVGGYAERDFSDPRGDERVLHEFLDQALSDFERGQARAVVIDLSLNHGGYDFIARAFAAHFADQRRPVYRKSPADALPPYQTELWLEPAAGQRYAGPVYLLTSDITVSGGEILTLALRALPQVIHVGAATRGALSDILEKPLGEGWVLTLSNEVYRDTQGQLWEGRGIEPQRPLPVFEAGQAPLAALTALRQMIERDLALTATAARATPAPAAATPPASDHRAGAGDSRR